MASARKDQNPKALAGRGGRSPWPTGARWRVWAGRFIGSVTRRRGGPPAHRPSGTGPGCGFSPNHAIPTPNPAGGGFGLGSGSHVRFCRSIGRHEIKLRRHQGPASWGVVSAPSTVRPLARDLRVLIGWPFPLGFGLNGRLLLERRGRVYVSLIIIISVRSIPRAPGALVSVVRVVCAHQLSSVEGQPSRGCCHQAFFFCEVLKYAIRAV